jgi:hypothetical protein
MYLKILSEKETSKFSTVTRVVSLYTLYTANIAFGDIVKTV